MWQPLLARPCSGAPADCKLGTFPHAPPRRTCFASILVRPVRCKCRNQAGRRASIKCDLPYRAGSMFGLRTLWRTQQSRSLHQEARSHQAAFGVLLKAAWKFEWRCSG